MDVVFLFTWNMSVQYRHFTTSYPGAEQNQFTSLAATVIKSSLVLMGALLWFWTIQQNCFNTRSSEDDFVEGKVYC